MSSYELGHFWEQILEKTKQKIAPPIWDKVIYSGLFPSSMENNTLTLYAMHDFIKNLVQGNRDLIDKISQAASEIANQPISVIILDLEQPVTQTADTSNYIHSNNNSNNNNNSNTTNSSYTNSNTNNTSYNSNDTNLTNSNNNLTTTNNPSTDDLDSYVPPSNMPEDKANYMESNSSLSDISNSPTELKFPYQDILQLEHIEVTEKKDKKPIFSPFNENLYEEPIKLDVSHETKSSKNDAYYRNNSIYDTHLSNDTYSNSDPFTKTVNQSTDTNRETIGQNNENKRDDAYFINTLKLNKSYTFSNFVVGNSNRIPHSAAKSVAETPAQTYNPLFIYGESGLGKTHLMHAIGNYIIEHYPHLKICCISSETFMNDLVTAIRIGNTDKFREKYRNIDVLLIDDIQFFQSKEFTQTEFFHTFNALQMEGKQIVLTSDTLPSNMKNFSDRLQSRFESGYVVNIESPDLETRTAILQSRLEKERYKNPSLEISNEVINFIASKVKNNIRTLEGAFNKLINTANITKEPITMDFTYKIIKDLIGNTSEQHLSIPTIQQCISEYFKIKLDDLLGQKRKKHLAYPRQIAMYLCRQLINASYPTIAESFGKKDHTTVLHAYEKIERERKTNEETKKYIQEIVELLKEKCE